MTSCTGMTDIPSISREAASLIAVLENQNNRLKTFKGTGKLAVRDQFNVQNSRAAWIGHRNEKLRISILNISGQPAVSFASDGNYFYAVSHFDSRFYKAKSSDPGLGQFMAIPVKTSELIHILCGKVPVKDFYSAQIIANNDDYILVLKTFWGNIREKIWFNKQTKQVARFEIYGSGQNIQYQVDFDNYQSVSEYTIPFNLSISDKDSQIELEIDRYWADPPVSSTVFILKKPGQ
ncbi:lipoprotein insertase outer membrane protein LolB [Desulfonema limicola]|nr:DUF4292 domain-containing protein [Desulfonema limicola]